MNFELIREKKGEKATIGELTLTGGAFKSFTLEDIDRNLFQQTPLQDIIRKKVFGKTAIPYGTYQVAMTYSNRFKKIMPELLNVPGFEGIRIHSGNTDADTEGCLLVGDTNPADDFIGESRAAIARLYPLLQDACSKEKVFITIKEANENAA